LTDYLGVEKSCLRCLFVQNLSALTMMSDKTSILEALPKWVAEQAINGYLIDFDRVKPFAASAV
jgi:hypothetical protein